MIQAECGEVGDRGLDADAVGHLASGVSRDFTEQVFTEAAAAFAGFDHEVDDAEARAAVADAFAPGEVPGRGTGDDVGFVFIDEREEGGSEHADSEGLPPTVGEVVLVDFGADLAAEDGGARVAWFFASEVEFEEERFGDGFESGGDESGAELGMIVEDAGELAAAVNSPIKGIEREMSATVDDLGPVAAQVVKGMRNELGLGIRIGLIGIPDEHGDAPHGAIEAVRGSQGLFGAETGVDEAEDAGVGFREDHPLAVEEDVSDDEGVEFMDGEGTNDGAIGAELVPEFDQSGRIGIAVGAKSDHESLSMAHR